MNKTLFGVALFSIAVLSSRVSHEVAMRKEQARWCAKGYTIDIKENGGWKTVSPTK